MPVDGFPGIHSTNTLGRMYTIHPNNSECFFLRILLHNVVGPETFPNLKTVDNIVFETYRETCLKPGLLKDDQHWDDAMFEANETKSPRQLLLSLFTIILTSCNPSNPQYLWEKYKESMSKDILYRWRISKDTTEIDFDNEIFNESLIKIDDACVLEKI
ncbi:unnamed protein product [Macrosiphum euphorbiae]|nr:unnamed protein product [Macrosiphum euphorbiae]